jgi:tetratricopeptide (TPR) repeat protein
MRRALAALAVALAMASASARAETPPTVWDAVRTPGSRAAYQVHLAVRDLLLQHSFVEEALRHGQVDRVLVGRAFLEQARLLLLSSDAETSPDVRLRFDLGLVLQRLGAHRQAADVLGAALKHAPEHPAADEAWLAYALALANLGRTEEEREAYQRYLALATEESRRVTPLLNLAEAEMRLGNLREAVEGYREVRALASRFNAGDADVLAAWGLAVALDRSGDDMGAARVAREAMHLDPPAVLQPWGARAPLPGTYVIPPGLAGQRPPIRLPNAVGRRLPLILDEETVFFVPRYERLWYLALGEAEVAREATDPRIAVERWETVVALRAGYVREASAAPGPPDRWLPIARLRLEQARRNLDEARKRVPADRGAEKPRPKASLDL